jgi:hypothetical protein
VSTYRKARSTGTAISTPVPGKSHSVFYHSQAVRNAYIKVKDGKILNIGSMLSVIGTINHALDHAGWRNG